MKKPLLYIGSVLIFILAAVAFVFVPAHAGNSISGKAVVFGKYDGKPVEYKPNSELALNIARYEQIAKQQGQSIEGFTWFYIYTYAFRDTIGQIARKSAVKKFGYAPSDKSVARATLALPYFLDENGKYDPKKYNILSNDDKESLKESLRTDLVISRFDGDYLGSNQELGGKKLYGLKTAKGEAEFISAIGENKRSFDLVAFDKSEYPDEEVRKFAEENKTLFDKFDISAISFKDEATAKKILGQLSGNALEFKDAIGEEYSEKYYTDAEGKVTASYRYQIKGILEDESVLSALDSLAENSYSDLIKTSKGWTIFKKDGATVQADFGKSNSVDFSAITFDSSDLAESVREKLAANELELADAFGDGKKTYTDDSGKLNAKTKSELEEILANKDDAKSLDALAVDAWSKPIQTAEGWTIFKKDSNPVTDAFDVAKRYISSNESTKIEDYFISRTKDFTSAAMLNGFEEAAKAFSDAEQHSVEGIALNYGGTSIASKLPEDVKPLSSAASNENFWTKAFSLKMNEFSEPIVVGNYVIALKMKGEEKTASDENQISSVKGEIEKFDREDLDSAILSSKKVEDKVWDAYAKLHM